MCVADQGKKCRQRKNRPKRSFTQKVPACFAFVVIACDIPKRPCTSVHIMRARSLEDDRMIIVICDRQAAASAFATVECLVTARTNGCWECWFHNSLFPMRCAVHVSWIQKFFPTTKRSICSAPKQGLPARPGSHTVGAGNWAEAVSILVAGAVHCRSGCSRRRSHIDFTPRFPARSGPAGESAHPIAARGLCEFEFLSPMSSRKLCELARIFSSHYDAGGNATEFAA